jgi:hypothetical protein
MKNLDLIFKISRLKYSFITSRVSRTIIPAIEYMNIAIVPMKKSPDALTLSKTRAAVLKVGARKNTRLNTIIIKVIIVPVK